MNLIIIIFLTIYSVQGEEDYYDSAEYEVFTNTTPLFNITSYTINDGNITVMRELLNKLFNSSSISLEQFNKLESFYQVCSIGIHECGGSLNSTKHGWKSLLEKHDDKTEHLEGQISDLEQLNSKWEEKIANLSLELAHAQETVEKHALHLTVLREQNVRLIHKMKVIKKKYKEKNLVQGDQDKEEIKKLRNEISEKDAEIARLQKEIQNIRDESSNNQGAIDEEKKKLNKCNQDLKNATDLLNTKLVTTDAPLLTFEMYLKNRFGNRKDVVEELLNEIPKDLINSLCETQQEKSTRATDTETQPGEFTKASEIEKQPEETTKAQQTEKQPEESTKSPKAGEDYDEEMPTKKNTPSTGKTKESDKVDVFGLLFHYMPPINPTWAAYPYIRAVPLTTPLGLQSKVGPMTQSNKTVAELGQDLLTWTKDFIGSIVKGREIIREIAVNNIDLDKVSEEGKKINENIDVDMLEDQRKEKSTLNAMRLIRETYAGKFDYMTPCQTLVPALLEAALLKKADTSANRFVSREELLHREFGSALSYVTEVFTKIFMSSFESFQYSVMIN